MAPLPAVHIIDDDDAVRDSMAVLLELRGLDVATYESAGAFLERPIAEVEGCVVTDVQMAETNGLELLRALRSLAPALPVIVITARVDKGLAARAAAHGAVAFLEKPFAPDALVEAVSAAMATAA